MSGQFVLSGNFTTESATLLYTRSLGDGLEPSQLLRLAGPTIVASIFLARQKGRRRYREGEWILILSLLAVLPTAVVFYGDPRFRVPYDVFGLALAGSLISAWLEHRSVRKIRVSSVAPGGAQEEAE